jgi:hypothetical protein
MKVWPKKKKGGKNKKGKEGKNSLAGSLNELNQILVECVTIGLAESINIVSDRAGIVLNHKGIAHSVVVRVG